MDALDLFAPAELGPFALGTVTLRRGRLRAGAERVGIATGAESCITRDSGAESAEGPHALRSAALGFQQTVRANAVERVAACPAKEPEVRMRAEARSVADIARTWVGIGRTRRSQRRVHKQDA